jgi:hypothetical protein
MIKQLIEDYRRRLATISEMLDYEDSLGNNANLLTLERYKTKKGEYKTFIAELEKALGFVEDKKNIAYAVFNPETNEYYHVSGGFVRDLRLASVFPLETQADGIMFTMCRYEKNNENPFRLEVKPIIMKPK